MSWSFISLLLSCPDFLASGQRSRYYTYNMNMLCFHLRVHSCLVDFRINSNEELNIEAPFIPSDGRWQIRYEY